MTYTRVCALADIEEPGAVHVEVGDVPIAVVRSDGELYAVQDICSHADIPLSEGDVDGSTIECWLHGSRFDLRTGKPTGPPAIIAVPVYPVRVDGDDVYIDVTEEN
ncbi:non-heme iron oxygenase ferredoxin subunit [soil metagenome]